MNPHRLKWVNKNRTVPASFHSHMSMMEQCGMVKRSVWSVRQAVKWAPHRKQCVLYYSSQPSLVNTWVNYINKKSMSGAFKFCLVEVNYAFCLIAITWTVILHNLNVSQWLDCDIIFIFKCIYENMMILLFCSNMSRLSHQHTSSPQNVKGIITTKLNDVVHLFMDLQSGQ